jgi:hypothetical protein
MGLTDFYRLFQTTAPEYTFFSTAHRIDHFLGHKESFNDYKNIEISSCILSGYSGIKLEFNSRRNYRKHSNTWRLNNSSLNDQWVTEKIRGSKSKIPTTK